MTTKSPLLSRPGAVEAAGPDAGVAAHYGEPLREQRALAAGTAVVDLSHRGVVTVTGPDRLSWLNTLSSQQLTALPPGQSTELLLLSVQGRIEFDARVLDDGATTWLIVEAAEAAPLAEWLNRMKFMLRVEIADVSGGLGRAGQHPAGAGVGRAAGLGGSLAARRRRRLLLRRGRRRTPTPGWSGPGSSTSSRPQSWKPPWRTARWPGSWPPRRCASPRGGRAGVPKPTTRPSRTNWTCCAPPSTWPRAATRARKPSPGCTTWATRRGGWSSCNWTARSTPCPPSAARCGPASGRSVR